MKIGLFSDAYLPYVSGVTTSLFMLAEGLMKQGHEVYIITVETKGDKAYDIDKPYIKRLKGFPYPFKALRNFKVIPFERRLVGKVKRMADFDCIHVHTEFSVGKVAYLLKKKTNVPMVYTSHTMYEEYFHYVGKHISGSIKGIFMYNLKKLFRRFIKKSEVTIVPSKKILDLMHDYGIEGNYKIVPTGIPLRKFRRTTYKEEDIQALKDSLGLKDEFVCLYVGRISAEKSIDVILEGFKKANQDNLKFVIVGDGPYMEDLRALVKTLNLEEKVILTGMVDWDKVGIYYQIGDCFLNASISETQGLTYIEALAAGMPLLVKYDSVLEAVLTDNHNGLFFHNNEDLPQLINTLKDDKELMMRLKKNATSSVKKYSQEEYVRAALETYEEAIRINQEKTLKTPR